MTVTGGVQPNLSPFGLTLGAQTGHDAVETVVVVTVGPLRGFAGLDFASCVFLYLTRAKRIQAISICKRLSLTKKCFEIMHTELCVKCISCKVHGLLIKRCCVFFLLIERTS